MVSEASVDLRVYDVDFTFEYEHHHHSILEFTSLLTVVDGKKKKVFGDDCRCEENGNKKKKIRVSPKFDFCPFLQNAWFSNYHHDGGGNGIICRLDDYLYFNCTPQELRKSLKMTLISDDDDDDKHAYSPPQEIKINYDNFEIKTDIDLSALCGKMFIQWQSLTESSFVPRFIKRVKLRLHLAVMKDLISAGFRAECRKIWNSNHNNNNNNTSIENKILEYEIMKKSVFPCFEFFFKFSKTLSDIDSE